MIIQVLKILLVAFVFTFAAFELVALVYKRFFNKKLIEFREQGNDLETGWKIKKIQERDKNG